MAPYNQRNTDDPLDIEYRVEARVTEHFDDIGVSQTQLDETYADRSQVENTINVVRTACTIQSARYYVTPTGGLPGNP